MTQPAAPPQLSPDGNWWWTGTEWVPAAQQPPVPQQPAPAPEPAPDLSGYAEPVTIVPSYSAPTYIAPTHTAPAYTAPTYGSPAYGTQVYGQAPSQNDSLAIISLVSGLVWVGGLGSVVAIVTGHLSRSKAKQEGRQPSGMALAGLVLGYLGASVIVVGILAAIAIPVFLNQRVAGDRAELKSDLRNLAVAEETYFTDHETYTTDEGALSATGYTPSPAVDVAVLRADARGYCLGAHKNSTTLFFDGTRFTTVSCV